MTKAQQPTRKPYVPKPEWKDDFQKTLNPLSDKEVGNVFIKVKFEGEKLSISGVEGPLSNGNCKGSCGQIRKPLSEYYRPTLKEGWNRGMYRKLMEVWEAWHLNDMQAGCEHQRADEWDDQRINPEELPNSHANSDERGIIATWVLETEHKNGLLCKPCEVCGYKYGTAWLTVEVPKDVILFLKSLPESTLKPAWL